MPTDWGGEPELQIPTGVSLWITAACMGMVSGAVLAVWAFRFGNVPAGLALLIACALSGLAMMFGLGYAECIRDEQGTR